MILGGVDASCGVGGVNNPKPVLLRILDYGNLPNNFVSNMKRCRVVGSGTGDISSERVYIRTEKLSCINNEGKVKELSIEGYIVAEDGKNGIRGRVADKSGMASSRAAMGGVLSGLSSYFKSNLLEKKMVTDSDNDENILKKFREMMQTGGSSGISNAFDKLSDYYIKRAEQLQPVIQIDAGRKVSIVITNGFEFKWRNPKSDPNKTRQTNKLVNEIY